MKLGGAWLALLLAAAGCYDPQIQNAGLQCAAGAVCPAGFHCASDNHCWQNGTDPPDGGDTGDADTGDQGGGGGQDLGDMTPGITPAAPTGLATVPMGPSQSLQPLVKGNAPAGTTVKIYANGACAGAPTAMGDAAAFANGVMVSAVSANTVTQFSATATDPNSLLTSACSTPVSYQHDNVAPVAPMLTGTLPPSPSASDTMPFVLGTSEAGSTIKLYTNASCNGTPDATGTAADLMGNGIQLTVAMSATTNIFATATDAAGNVSGCSTPALSYLEDPTLPPAPTNLTTNPTSPSKSATTFTLSGTSGANTTVKIFTTSNCSGALVTSGTAAQFASTGFPITVSTNSINNFYANATSAANRVGPCSVQVKYIEDELPPNVGAAQVRDGTGSDVHWQKVSDQMDANWVGFSDAASGILSYDYNLSTSNACTGDIIATTNLGLVSSQHSDLLALADGSTYFNCVRAYDGAGNVTAWVASNGVTIDVTPPASGTVRDGTAADTTWTGSASTMDANWLLFGDGTGSGLASFDYNLSTTPSCSGDVVAAVNFPASTMSAHLGALSLSSGVTYYNCVRALDQAGNAGAWVPSNGITVDTVPPVAVAATVRDGLGADIQYQGSTSSIAGNWSGFTDALSLIAGYEVNVSTSNACAGDVLAPSSVGGVTQATLSATLSASVTYYFCVRARDNANNPSSWVASNGVTVDTAAPTNGVVRDGAVIGLDVTWDTFSSSMSANWGSFTDDSGSIASYDWNVSTSTACTGNVVATGNGTSTSRTANGLSLTNGTQYFNCVRAWDAAGNVGNWVASNGVKVDIDLPTTGAVNDGVAGDLAWTKVTTSDSANWSGFADATSGIGSYEHNLSSSVGCTGDVLGNLMTGATNVTRAAALTSGNTYFNCVRVYDVAGNVSSFAASSSFTVDTTPPSTAGAVLLDGSTGPDQQYQVSTSGTNVRWSGFTDAGGSGVANYDWGLSTASDCSSFVSSVSGVGTSGGFNATGLGLTNGQKYYNCIRAVDLAGNLSAWAASDGVTVDNQPPSTAGAVVHDGASFPPDVQFQRFTNTLVANWSGFADNSGVASYLYNVSSNTSCFGDVVNFLSGTSTSATINSLSLSSGQTYYVCVAAVDVAGNVSSYVHSDGVTVDTQVPTNGTVRDGVGADIAFQSSLTQVQTNWLGFSDPISGIASYNYALSTQTDCSSPIVWMSVASTQGSGSLMVSASLTDGTKYYNCIQPVDAAGNQGTFARSDGVTVDSDKPTGGQVFDGTSPGDATALSSTTSMSVWWGAFTDGVGSGIGSYDWQLTTTSDCTGLPIAGQGGLSSGGALAFTKNGLSLTNGTTYYNCIRAVDSAGNIGDWVASNGVKVDNQAPRTISAVVNDGSAAGDIVWQSPIHSGGANWSGFSEPGGESGIVSYDFNLSTSNACAGTVIAPTNVGLVTSYSWNNGGVTLSNAGTFYYSCIRAWDAAGNVSAWVASNAFRIDTTAPTLGSVNDGGGSDVAWWNSTTMMSSNWSGFSDSQSGIFNYEWGLSTSATCASIDVAGPHSTGAFPSDLGELVTLTEGTTYYNCVRATDNAGNTSAWKPSNGVRIDVSPPVVGTVRDGLSGDATWTTSTTTASANWIAALDNLSGTNTYDFAIANDAACGSTVGSPFLNIGNVTTITKMVGMSNGQTYFSCVRPTDLAGNIGAWKSSNGFTVDTVAPSLPGPPSLLAGNGQMTVSYSAATDSGSGIDYYDILTCTGSGCMPMSVSNSDSNLTVTVGGLTNCVTYGFAVRAHDHAGNIGNQTATVYGAPALPNPGSVTVVPRAGGFEYAIPTVPNATQYRLCWGPATNPCSAGSFQTQPYTNGFVDTVALNTAFVAVKATDANGCFSTPVQTTISMFGLSSLASAQSVTSGQSLGYTVAMVGDVDGDGNGDYAISHGWNYMGTHSTAVFVNSGATNATLWQDTGGNGGVALPSDYFGAVIAGGGDVNGDGINDIIITSPGYGPDFTNASKGGFNLVNGKTGSTLCSAFPAVLAAGQRLGSSAAIIGDVTSDGRPDMLIGASSNNGSGPIGRAYVYKYDGTVNCALVRTHDDPGMSNTDFFGNAVAAMADFDGDSVMDYAIAAPRGSNSVSNTGLLWIFSGASGAQLGGAAPFMGPLQSFIGNTLATAGDVDADGYADLIAGGSNTVVVFSGKDGHSISTLTSFATSANDQFGYTVGPAGDINGDGYADYFVGAPQATVAGMTNAGSIYVFSGANATLLYQLDGAAGTNLGNAVGGGGDTNADGRPDLVVGRYERSCGAGGNCGEWFVYSPSRELGFAPHAELASPWAPFGYMGMQTPNFVAPGGISFTGLGGTGPYSWGFATVGSNNSGGLISLGGSYNAGPTLDVLDTIRVTDSLSRQFDTRVFVKSAAGSTRPDLPRALSLKVVSTPTQAVNLSWSLVPAVPVGSKPLLEYRTGTGTWNGISLAAGTNNYSFTTGSQALQYRFRVKLQKPAPNAADSLWSNEVIAAPGP